MVRTGESPWGPLDVSVHSCASQTLSLTQGSGGGRVVSESGRASREWGVSLP